MQSSSYPRHHPADFNDLGKLIEEYVLPGFCPDQPIFDASSVIRTQGSCFAENIHNAINERGFTSNYFSFSEAVNSPLANNVFFDRLSGQNKIPFHSFHDRIFPTRLLQKAGNQIPNEHVFIFTVGVAGCWFEAGTDVPCIEIDPKKLDSFAFRWLSAEENAKHLASIIDIIHGFNPDMQIVLTLSPVPLNRAFGFASAVVADCLSKSTLRVAIDMAMASKRPNVHYWPSFEIVRWLGGHLPPVFGTDDGQSRHVSQDLINLIVRLFLKHYGRLS